MLMESIDANDHDLALLEHSVTTEIGLPHGADPFDLRPLGVDLINAKVIRDLNTLRSILHHRFIIDKAETFAVAVARASLAAI